MDENKKIDECDSEINSHNHKQEKTESWIKFALLLIALFIACYLAVYYVMDQIRHAYYIPSMPVENIDRIIKEQDKMFERDFGLGAFPMQNKALMIMKAPVETYKDDKDNAYKMIINLKPFNNNPKNIDIKISDNQISINGVSEKSKGNAEKIYSFSQSFVLPEKIDTQNVTKEKQGHKYIVTMPIEDVDFDED